MRPLLVVIVALATLAACHHTSGETADACTVACSSTCTNAATDCTPMPCQAAACGDQMQCLYGPDPMQDGTSCGSGMTCKSGECISANCGDGVVQPPEQCDFGAGNGSGTGCEVNCTFSCTTSPDSCVAGNSCNGQACTAVTVSGATGQKCVQGSIPADGTSCGGANICLNATCVAPTCGDGFVDQPSEQCDDGALDGTPGDGCTSSCTFVCQNAATDCGAPPACQKFQCTAGHTCQAVADATKNGMSCGTGMTCSNGSCLAAGATCGDGIREAGEQCDDGNTTNLDGCDATCHFEQVQRFITFGVALPPNATDTFCTKNALGASIVGSTAQSDLQSSINSGIADGSITIELDVLGLSNDLNATTNASFMIGMLGGTPVAGTGYNGASDLDWWYTTDPTTIDAMRVASTQMAATVAASVINAGPAEISVTVSFVGVKVTMDEFGAKLRATVGASSTPTTSSGTTPGHVAGEHLDPALTSFGGLTAGELCSSTSAASLAGVQTPSVLVGSTCNNFYTTSNTLLDIYISGCKAFGIVPEVTPTQPDTSRDGATYRFTADSSHHVVSCTKNGVADTLSDCFAKAGYTSLFKFTSDRVIAK